MTAEVAPEPYRPLRPPMTYFGGKIRLAPKIVSLMPEHKHYVEPFAGSLAVLLAKPPAPHETVNDLDEELVRFWRVLRDRPDELERACALTPHSRVEHRLSYEATDDDLESARRMWVQLTQGRAGERHRTGWRHYCAPAGSSSMPRYLRGYVGRIAPAVERLARVSLECRPALDVIAAYGRHDEVFLYCDLPYHPETRRSGAYLHELSPAEHATFLTTITAPEVKAAVMVSGYSHPDYEAALTGWDRVEIATATYQGGSKQERTEVVWCNRPMIRDSA